jgi:uncharacterized membrane protein
VQLLAFTVVGLCALVAGYAFGLGGALSTMLFLAILFVGILIRVSEPLLRLLRP